MSPHYIGYEDAFYQPRDEPPCPCIDGGLLDCYCGGIVSLSDARDWLIEQGVHDAHLLHADEVIGEVNDRHPEGFEGFYDEQAAEKASARLRGFDYSGVIGRAA